MRAYEFIFEARIAKTYDQKDIDDVKAAYDEKMSYEDIAAVTGLPVNDVTNILTRHYGDRPRRNVFNKAFSQRQIDDVKTAYDDGRSYEEIAHTLGLSKNDINVIMKRYYDDRPRRRRHGLEYTERDINDVKWAYDQGHSYEDIARQIGVEKSDVSVMLDRYYPERKRRAEHLASALTADDKNSIILSFAGGKDVALIANDFGIAPSLVKKVVSDEFGAEEFKNELARRRSLPGRKITNKVKPEMIPIMRAAYKQGKSTEEIADMLDNVITSTTVYKTLQKQPDWEDLRAEWERNRVPVRHEGPATTRVFRSGWGGASGVKGPSSKHRSPAKWWGE